VLSHKQTISVIEELGKKILITLLRNGERPTLFGYLFVLLKVEVNSTDMLLLTLYGLVH